MNMPVTQTGFSLAQGLRVYAIGDIHGFSDALDRMHDAIAADLLDRPPESAHIVYLGDYIDRGPDSKGVIDRLIARQTRGDGIEKTFILGNHEMGLYEFTKNPHESRWLIYGGIETLKSYGITFMGDIPLPGEIEDAAGRILNVLPPSHREFLEGLEYYRVIGDYVFVHAGIDPLKPLEKNTVRDFTFIREPFLSWPAAFSKMIVHGHTISEKPEIKKHRIGVDTGLYAGGKLTGAVLEGGTVRFLQV